MFSFPRRQARTIAAVGMAIGCLLAAETPAAAGTVTPLPIAASVQLGAGGIVFVSTFPSMALCEQIPTENCFRFTDSTVVGQLAPFEMLGLLLGILGLYPRGCTTVANIDGGSPEVDEIYIGSAVPVAITTGDCGDVAAQVASHALVLVVPLTTEPIPPSVVSVVDLSPALAQTARAGPTAR